MASDPAFFPWDWDAETFPVGTQGNFDFQKLNGSTQPHDAEPCVCRNRIPSREEGQSVPRTGLTSLTRCIDWKLVEHVNENVASVMADTYRLLSSGGSIGQANDSSVAPESSSIVTGCKGGVSFAAYSNDSDAQSPANVLHKGVHDRWKSAEPGATVSLESDSQLSDLVLLDHPKTHFASDKTQVSGPKIKVDDIASEGGKKMYMDEQHNDNATGSTGSGDSLTGLQLGKQTYSLGATSATGKVAQKPILATKKARTAVAVPRCQVKGCKLDLTSAKDYHRRHKVCEPHSKSEIVVVASLEQRFCQQCSRFHLLCEFDEAKRSCRRQLAGHNERRRKPQAGPLHYMQDFILLMTTGPFSTEQGLECHYCGKTRKVIIDQVDYGQVQQPYMKISQRMICRGSQRGE